MKKKLLFITLALIVFGLVGLGVLFSIVKEAPLIKQLLSKSSDSKAVTVAQLGEHASEEDCLVAYKNEVFDITWFISQHAGGLQIVSLCGQQADQFSSQHPGGSFEGPKIQGILKMSKVGTLKTE